MAILVTGLGLVNTPGGRAGQIARSCDLARGPGISFLPVRRCVLAHRLRWIHFEHPSSL
uniref:Uncharacterized protein n=1 Tax=Triticum urartu TaxID=4572 RepID=A0A8R7QK18_TRIUA